ncbi:MAG TPA: LysR family transcriptional regulator [Candidatus Aphodovivens avistercoris]|nr:LysR family transcriptional regulator [Candidatus Aphodovivens avistercoris]
MLLDEVEILTTIAETKSLSRAADRLYLSRPGLSKKISRLEERYGVKLYERTPSGVALTPAGDIFTKFAKKVSDLEETLAAELAAVQESFNSTIEVGMALADAETLLPPAVRRFLDVYPNEYIHLDAGYEIELMEKLKDGSLDFAVLENAPLDDEIARETLGYKRLTFLAPNKPPYNTAAQPIPVTTLFKWPCVSYERECGFHLTGNRFFRERYGLALRSEDLVVQFDSWESRIIAVREGIGWASMPEVIAERHKGDPDLIRLKIDCDDILYPVDIAWHADHDIPEPARRFMAFFKAHLPAGYFRQK